MSNKIFISHAAADEQVVTAFVNLLHNGMDINNDEIFCSSVPDSIRIGDDFVDKIRDEIKDCECVMFLISPEFKESRMCMFEMGAAWALGKNIKPIIVPPLTFRDLDKIMDRNQGIMITSKEGLDQLFGELKVQKIAKAGSLQFVKKLDEFIVNSGILMADENGLYHAIVTEIYEKPDSDLVFYKLNGKINKAELRKLTPTEDCANWNEEQHWIFADNKGIEGLRTGDMISFSLTGSSYMKSIPHGSKILTKVRNLYYENPSIEK